jgi:CubicO group peptidase (beta-lactamase class C family)
MTRCLALALALACCLPLSGLTRASSLPAADTKDTPAAEAAATEPARQALDAWLAAFNANDRAQLEAFRDRFHPTMDVERMLGFHGQTGGFRLIRHEPSDAGSAQALLQEAQSDTVARITVTLSDGAPLALSIEAIDRPADLALPRLDQGEAIAALTARADAAAAQDAFAGVLLVARGDEVLLQGAWGQADRESAAPVTLDTRFRLGSMNKMFTAVSILQLVDAGKLSLDGTVGDYLPDYPNAEVAKVTIRQLLTHSGGTGDIFGPQFDEHRLSLKSHADYLRLYGERAPEHPPGAEFRYSNYGFVLLGNIIERVSGQSYYDYVDQHIYTPAGMTSSGSLPEDTAVAGRARAYTRGEGGSLTDAGDTLPWRGTAAGGGYSTAGDLLKFARALQSGTLLPPALLAEATREQGQGYGYGFGVRMDQGVPVYGHGGGAPGMNGELRIFPTLGEVVIGLGNVDPPAVSRLVDFYQARMPLAE